MKKFLGNKFIIGIAALLIGLALLCFPEAAIETILRVIGIILLIGCGIRVISFINNQERSTRDYVMLVVMGLVVILAILLLICPAWMVTVAFYLLGILVVAAGVWYFIHALRAPAIGYFRYVLIGIAVVAVVLGVLVITHPFASVISITKFTGFSFLVAAVQSFLAVAADQKNPKED